MFMAHAVFLSRHMVDATVLFAAIASRCVGGAACCDQGQPNKSFNPTRNDAAFYHSRSVLAG